MFTRRSFGKLTASLLAGASVPEIGALQAVASASSFRFSVMMWTLKDRGTFEENLERAALAGYRQVELVDEYKTWAPSVAKRILARMATLGITVDAVAGMKLGFADLGGGEAFVGELKSLIPKIKDLGCGQVILLSGKRADATSGDIQHKASVETLKHSAELLYRAGLTGVIEPIDLLENPTIYLDGVEEAFKIVAAIASPNVKVLYDIYHEQRGYGNVIEKFQQHVADVALVHIADVPGRHQPGTGEINFGNIFSKLKQLGYKGTIAMEFYPSGDIVKTLRSAREQASNA